MALVTDLKSLADSAKGIAGTRLVALRRAWAFSDAARGHVAHRFILMRGEEANAFLVMLAQHVQAQEVGRAGLGARAGDDRDHFAIAHIAMLLQQALGDSPPALRSS